MMWWGNWDGWGGALVMSIAMLVFWGGLIMLVAYAIRESSRPRDRESDAPSAMRILEERFARGEIDRDEFEERRRILDPKAT